MDGTSVVATAPVATVIGRKYRIRIPNNIAGGTFWVDLGAGTTQFGSLGPANTHVEITAISASSTIRIGRWALTPVGTVGSITIR
jgi:hypothetical protein